MMKQHTPPKHTQTIALWQQLQHVADVLVAVQGGTRAADVLSTLPQPLRAGVQALSYEVLRHWGVGCWLRAQLVAKRPHTWVDALLSSVLALCWQQDDAQSSSYTDFTLVNQAVEAIKRHGKHKRAAGLVNACLRRFLRERTQWQQQCQQASPNGLPELLNVPKWWLQRLQNDYPNHWVEIARAGQTKPPMVLRINARHGDAGSYIQQHLQPIGMPAVAVGAHAVQLHSPCAVDVLPNFDAGWVSVQDAAAQLAAPLLLQALKQHSNSTEAPRLLDACAAPGGKTAHLLELADNIHLTALEIDAERAQRIGATLARLQLNDAQRVRVQVADAAKPSDWFDGQAFDGIVLDAPCTASGIVRRHPDIAWLRRANDVAQLAQVQADLLDAMWQVLAPNGVLLYCTCSVFHAEGQAQIAAFLLRHSQARRLPAYGHILPTMGQVALGLGDNASIEALDTYEYIRDTARAPSYDGFFYALLHKPA